MLSFRIEISNRLRSRWWQPPRLVRNGRAAQPLRARALLRHPACLLEKKVLHSARGQPHPRCRYRSPHDPVAPRASRDASRSVHSLVMVNPWIGGRAVPSIETHIFSRRQGSLSGSFNAAAIDLAPTRECVQFFVVVRQTSHDLYSREEWNLLQY